MRATNTIAHAVRTAAIRPKSHKARKLQLIAEIIADVKTTGSITATNTKTRFRLAR